MLPIASQRGLPVISARLMPIEREQQADERAGVLEQHDRELGALRGADEAPPRAALAARRWPRGARCAATSASSTIATPSTTNATDRRLELVRVDELLDALVQREHRAEREQHERDDERPEVALGAEAERVLRGGRLAAALAAEEQQALVAGVGDRVDRLGEHRRRAGDRRTRRTSRPRCRGWRGTRRRSPAGCPQSTSAHRPTPCLVATRAIVPSAVDEAQHRRAALVARRTVPVTSSRLAVEVGATTASSRALAEAEPLVPAVAQAAVGPDARRARRRARRARGTTPASIARAVGAAELVGRVEQHAGERAPVVRESGVDARAPSA